MTFQMDYSKPYTKGCGLRMTNQALLKAFSFVMLSLLVVLGWESTRPLGSRLVNPLNTQNIIQSHLGEAVTAHALWASTEEDVDGSGERMLEAEPAWKATDVKTDGDLDLSENSVHRLKDVTRRAEDVPDRMGTREEQPPHQNLNLSTSSKSPSPTQQLDAEELVRLAKQSGAIKPSIAREDLSETVGTSFEELLELEGSEPKRAVCDFTRGRWVKDEQRPLYSGRECKAYLSEPFACREMNRPNFEYEKLRWQPEGCDLPPFTRDGFLQRLQNKVVAFVGDSLGRQQFQSLMCMITEGKRDESVEDVRAAWSRDVSLAFRFRSTNTTVLFHWSASLCEIEQGHPMEQPGYSAMHLDRPPRFLKNFLHKLDVVILNTGHHWNRGKLQSNKWHPYVNGKPNMDPKLAGMAEALDFTVHKVVQWLDAKLAEDSKGKQQPAVFMRTMSPRHFKNGDWNSGGTCDNSIGGSSNVSKKEEPVIPTKPYKGPITTMVAEIAVQGTRVNLLNITHLSSSREEGHISKYGKGKDSEHQDCLHWCLPGVPDVWNELLYGNLVSDPSLSPL